MNQDTPYIPSHFPNTSYSRDIDKPVCISIPSGLEGFAYGQLFGDIFSKRWRLISYQYILLLHVWLDATHPIGTFLRLRL